MMIVNMIIYIHEEAYRDDYLPKATTKDIEGIIQLSTSHYPSILHNWLKSLSSFGRNRCVLLNIHEHHLYCSDEHHLYCTDEHYLYCTDEHYLYCTDEHHLYCTDEHHLFCSDEHHVMKIIFTVLMNIIFTLSKNSFIISQSSVSQCTLFIFFPVMKCHDKAIRCRDNVNQQ